MFAFKIWIIASILMTAYGDLSDSDDDICADDDPDLCHSEQTRKPTFPENVEALDKMCPAVLVRLNCLLEYQNKCGNVRPGSMEERLDTIYEIALEACDETSELHQEFADNLPCIKSILSNHRDICEPIMDDAVESVKNRIFGESAEDIELLGYRKLFCLYEAFDYACTVAQAGVKCGSETKEFIGKIMNRVGFLDVICEADVREVVKELVEIMQVEMEEKLALEQIFSEK